MGYNIWKAGFFTFPVSTFCFVNDLEVEYLLQVLKILINTLHITSPKRHDRR